MIYDQDETCTSPPLLAVRVRNTPSPDPSFLLPPPVCNSSPDSDQDSDRYPPNSKRKRMKKTKASPADAVLIGIMSNGNRPDLQAEVSEKPLTDDPPDNANASTVGESDDEMVVDVVNDLSPPPSITSVNLNLAELNEASVTETGYGRSSDSQIRNRPTIDTSSTTAKQEATSRAESATVKAEPHQPYPYLTTRKTASSQADALSIGILSSGTRPSLAADTKGNQVGSNSGTSKSPPTEQRSLHNESPSTSRPLSRRQYDHSRRADTDSLATSPNLGQYTIPDSQGSPMDHLPPLKNSPPQSMKSPIGHQNLPSLHSQLGSLSNGPPLSESGLPPNSSALQPRTAFVSVNTSAHSAPQDFKSSRSTNWPSIQTRTNGNFHPNYPTTEPSPASTISEASPRESYRSGQDPTSMSPPGKLAPRHIQPNGFTPQSTSDVQTPLSAESQQSVSDFASETSPTGDRMSIDGERLVLPAPSGTDAAIGGGFKCTSSGCTAAPFQTQYLLNSHANVHSQDRPHYCPVKTCPRSEAGKGFKRKNEMIRHGLVHQSPGYICPFCPEREHKYPRPDNLQRHVKVHHVGKSKDDPELRNVLAQRIEGGSRGRRKRLAG